MNLGTDGTLIGTKHYDDVTDALGGEITAVPAPLTPALLAIGALALRRFARRRA